ncbi:hypothetical protein Goari_005569, partial [Gossypium aridum]|nr:hypothetical protein [Gossypium aridum]
MAMDSNPTPNLSWKDKLLGGETIISGSDCNVSNEGSESELELLEGDVSTTMVNGIPTIAFSDRNKNKILFKEIKLTVVLKLLGFKDNEDYNRVLTQGPWILYGQYLTIQTWTKYFSPSQPYPSVAMAWIWLSSLPRYMYDRKIIEAIGGLIGK